MDSAVKAQLQRVLREDAIPFFSDEDLEFYYSKNSQDFNKTAYECLLVKAENTTVSMAGMEIGDSSVYFRRLASRYRPHNSGVLSGGA